MDTQTNKTLVVRIFEEAINQNKPELAEQLFHEEFADHNPLERQPTGPSLLMIQRPIRVAARRGSSISSPSSALHFRISR